LSPWLVWIVRQCFDGSREVAHTVQLLILQQQGSAVGLKIQPLELRVSPDGPVVEVEAVDVDVRLDDLNSLSRSLDKSGWSRQHILGSVKRLAHRVSRPGSAGLVLYLPVELVHRVEGISNRLVVGIRELGPQFRPTLVPGRRRKRTKVSEDERGSLVFLVEPLA